VICEILVVYIATECDAVHLVIG